MESEPLRSATATPLPVGMPEATLPAEPRMPVPPAPRGRPRLWMFWLGLALVIGSAAYVILKRTGTQAPVTGLGALRTAKAARGDLQRTMRLSGTVAAREYAAVVAPRMQGRSSGGPGGDQLVLIKLGKPGSQVQKGEVVAEFDRQSMLQKIEDQQATVVQAEADIAKKKAELAILRETTEQNVRKAKAELDKARLDLKTAEVKSEIDAEKLKLAAEEAAARYVQIQEELHLLDVSQKAEIRTLEIQRDRAKLDRERAQLNADKMVMRATIGGIVVLQSTWRQNDQIAQVQEGEQVWPGTYFMQIVNPKQMVLNAMVNQTDSQELRLGQAAEIQFDAYPGLVSQGRLISLGAMANPTRFGWGGTEHYVRQIPVRFSIEARDARIIPDLSGSATVLLKQEKNVVTAPGTAFWEEGGKTFVQVKRPQGGWEKRQVQLGLNNQTQAAVRSGLNEGEEVALDRAGSAEERK